MKYTLQVIIVIVIFTISILISTSYGYSYKYVIENNCPSKFKYLESTIVKSNCDVPFGTSNITYNIPADGKGERAGALTTINQCSAVTLFEGGVSDYNDILFADVSNIDGFTAGLNVTAYYSDGTIKNIHCCSGCKNTTDSPNCWGPGNYWFPTEIEGYGTVGWSTTNLNLLLTQWSCLADDDLNACNGIKCQNDGVCMGGMRAPDNKSGLCLCQPGYEGTRCEVKTNYTPCYGVNCGFYGVCNATTASAGGNKCTCTQGYTGELCTVAPSTSSCYNVDCGPRSICKNGQCECQAGSSGCGCSTLGNCTIINNFDYQGNDLPSGTYTLNTPEECCSQCQKTPLCYAFTMSGNQCYLKSGVPANGGSAQNGKSSGYLPNKVTMDPCVSYNGSSTILSLSSSLSVLFILIIVSSLLI